MIQNEELTGLMKGTIPFTDEILSGLSDLIKKYPYFQAAHLLHTLNLLQLKDTHFLYDLRKTAIYVPDRKMLFFHVKKDSFAQKIVEVFAEETIRNDSTLELIDSFLSGKVEKSSLENIKKESFTVATDYVSYFLSGGMDNDETPPLQHQETIDKFLEKEAVTSLNIKLKNQDNREDEHQETIPESPTGESFFTVTLAKIFIKQKKYNKALEIIRKLNLIYPEKSSYFADQIRFLEKLINYSNKNK